MLGSGNAQRDWKVGISALRCAGMRLVPLLATLLIFGSACSSAAPPGSHPIVTDPTGGNDGGHPAHEAGGAADAPPSERGDAGHPDGGAADAGIPCSVDGNPGECMAAATCAAIPNHTSTAGYCPGPASVECCTLTPNVADNPPIPAGYMLMQQADVTTAMTAWAVSILHNPTTYPVFATATQTFGTLMVLARVEWHPPDFQNSVVHRGVTLYEPI